MHYVIFPIWQKRPFCHLHFTLQLCLTDSILRWLNGAKSWLIDCSAPLKTTHAYHQITCLCWEISVPYWKKGEIVLFVTKFAPPLQLTFSPFCRFVCKCSEHQINDGDANQVSQKVCPQKSLSKHHVTDECVAEWDKPWPMYQLWEFHKKRMGQAWGLMFDNTVVWFAKVRITEHKTSLKGLFFIFTRKKFARFRKMP